MPPYWRNKTSLISMRQPFHQVKAKPGVPQANQVRLIFYFVWRGIFFCRHLWHNQLAISITPEKKYSLQRWNKNFLPMLSTNRVCPGQVSLDFSAFSVNISASFGRHAATYLAVATNFWNLFQPSYKIVLAKLSIYFWKRYVICDVAIFF